MSEFGAYLLDENGYIFYETGMDVMSFKDKITLRMNDTARTEYDLMIPDTAPIIPFIRCNTQALRNNSPYCEITKTINKNWALSFFGGACELVDVYIFSVNVIQPIPKYGMALFNDNGECVLTNETKRLNVERSGEINSLRASMVLDGSFAVYPQYSGTIICSGEGVEQGKSWDIDCSYIALYNGTQTRIHGLAVGDDAHMGNFGSSDSNAYSPSIYIDTTPYD